MKTTPYKLTLKIMNAEDLYLLNLKVIFKKTDKECAMMIGINPKAVALRYRKISKKFASYFTYFTKYPTMEPPKILIDNFPEDFIDYIQVRFLGPDTKKLHQARRIARRKLGTEKLNRCILKIQTIEELEDYVTLLNIKSMKKIPRKKKTKT